MPLRVWMPLNGNLNQQGCSTITAIQSVAPTWVGGKTGKAMSTGGFYLPASEVGRYYNNEAMSFCFWLYPVGSSGNSHIIGQSAMAAGDNRMFTIFQYPTPNDLHLSWQNNDQNNTTFFGMSATGFFTANKWTHCTIVYNGSSVKVYRDGSLYNTYSCTKATRTNFSYNVPVPSVSIRYLSDLRIYDHALSDKEVKEISKGLVLHYPLSSQYEIGKINKIQSPYCDGEFSSSSFTKTKLANERGYNYKLTYTGNGTNYWPNAKVPNFTFTVGKRYFYSIKVRCNKWTVGNLWFRASRSDNDYVTNYVAVCSPSLADGKWHEYSVSQVINSTYERSGSTITCNPVLEVYTDNFNINGTLYDCDFDVKDIQVVESEEYVPFIKNEYADTIVRDESGFGNYGNAIGNVSYVSNTPKYKGALYCPNGTGVFGLINIDFSEFTISFWGKHTVTGKMLFGSNQSPSIVNSYWYWYGDNSFKFPLGEFYYEHNAGSAESLLNTWIHFVAIYDGAKLTVYRNGVYEGNKAFSGSVNLGYASIGNGYSNTSYWENGYVSDLRIYSTVLTEADVRELYNSGVSISNNGVLMAYGFNEDE